MPHQATYKIAHETFVLPHYIEFPGGRGPLYFSAMLIRAKEPVLIDTGGPRAREPMLDAIWSLVDPRDLRWIFITHDDRDHLGNLTEVLAAAPNAQVVMTWLMYAKMMPEFRIPLSRTRWVNHEDSFSVGDRTLVAVRPPAYDAPTTRGLFDPTTRVYFSGDCFGAPVPKPCEDVGDVPEDVYRENLIGFNIVNHPWTGEADQAKFDKQIARIDALDAEVIASSHAPAARGRTKQLLEWLRIAPSLPPLPAPDQARLEALIASGTRVM